MQLHERDVADKNEEEENETTTMAAEDNHNGSVNVCAAKTTYQKYNDMTLHYFDQQYNSKDVNNSNSNSTCNNNEDDEMNKLRRIICKRQREIIRNSKTSIDRFLTVHYAQLNESDAFARYSALINKYNSSNNEFDDKVDDLPRFRLRLDC